MPLSIPEIRNIGTVHWRHVESFAAQVEITWDITLDTSEPHKVTAGRGMFTMLALSWGNWTFYCNILHRFYIPLALLKPLWRLHFGRLLKLQDIQKRQWKGLIEPKWRTSGQISSCFCLSAFCEVLFKLDLTTFSKENYMMIRFQENRFLLINFLLISLSLTLCQFFYVFVSWFCIEYDITNCVGGMVGSDCLWRPVKPVTGRPSRKFWLHSSFYSNLLEVLDKSCVKCNFNLLFARCIQSIKDQYTLFTFCCHTNFPISVRC